MNFINVFQYLSQARVLVSRKLQKSKLLQYLSQIIFFFYKTRLLE